MDCYSARQSLSTLIKSLTQFHETEGARVQVIAHELYDDVLWSVTRITALKDDAVLGLVNGESLHYIRCDLLQGAGNEWGHVPMDESMHPRYYSCPMSYLDMAPEQSRGWREGVHAYHAHREISDLSTSI